MRYLIITLAAAAGLGAAEIGPSSSFLRAYVQNLPTEVEELDVETTFDSGTTVDGFVDDERADYDVARRAGVEVGTYYHVADGLVLFGGSVGGAYTRQDIDWLGQADQALTTFKLVQGIAGDNDVQILNALLESQDVVENVVESANAIGDFGVGLNIGPYARVVGSIRGGVGAQRSYAHVRFTRIVPLVNLPVTVETEGDDDYGLTWEWGFRLATFLRVSPLELGAFGGWTEHRSRLFLDADTDSVTLDFTDLTVASLLNQIGHQEVDLHSEGLYFGFSVGFTN